MLRVNWRQLRVLRLLHSLLRRFRQQLRQGQLLAGSCRARALLLVRGHHLRSVRDSDSAAVSCPRANATCSLLVHGRHVIACAVHATDTALCGAPQSSGCVVKRGFDAVVTFDGPADLAAVVAATLVGHVVAQAAVSAAEAGRGSAPAAAALAPAAAHCWCPSPRRATAEPPAAAEAARFAAPAAAAAAAGPPAASAAAGAAALQVLQAVAYH